MYIRELSSLRGIAAIIVLLSHVFGVINRSSLPAGTENSLTVIYDFLWRMFNGFAAVQLFFVLSGLVLSLSLERGQDNRRAWLQTFYIRRIFRIYPALWLSLFLALALLPYERGSCLSAPCSTWAMSLFDSTYTLKQILMSFAGYFTKLNGPMWTLRVELFYSLLFPAFFLLLRNSKTRIVFGLFILGLALAPLSRFAQMQYGLAFALGSSIPLISLERIKAPYGLVAAASVAILLLARHFLEARFNVGFKTLEIIEMLFSFVLIAIIFHRKIDLGFLKNKLCLYLGDISYSIYILHFPLLFTLYYAVEKAAGAQAIKDSPNLYTTILAVVAIPVTIAVASAGYYLIEMPFQSLGRKVSRI